MKNQFEKIYIELTDICGAKCSFCPSPLRNTVRGEMDRELYLKILSSIKDRAKSISFHVLGDPLMVKDLDFFVDMAKDFQVDIVTLGKNINEKICHSLGKPQIHQIAFSLTQYCYDKKSFHPSYIQNILDASKNIKASNPNVFINYRLQLPSIKLESTAELLKLFEEKFNVNIMTKDINTTQSRIKLAEKVFLNIQAYFEWKEQGAKIEHKKCWGAIKQLAILSNGIVVPCCIDYDGKIELGDMKKQSLEEILDTKLYKNIKDGFMRDYAFHPYCQSCQYKIGKS